MIGSGASTGPHTRQTDAQPLQTIAHLKATVMSPELEPVNVKDNLSKLLLKQFAHRQLSLNSLIEKLV